MLTPNPTGRPLKKVEIGQNWSNMAKSFSFGFTSDDIDYSADEDDFIMQHAREERPLAHERVQKPAGKKPRLHKLEELVS